MKHRGGNIGGHDTADMVMIAVIVGLYCHENEQIGEGISSLPTDNERVLPIVSPGLAVNTEKA